MNKTSKAINLLSWHNIYSPSLNFLPFFLDPRWWISQTQASELFSKGSIPYATPPQKISAFKVWSYGKFYVDTAKAGPQSPDYIFVQNCNQKTHWFFIITKSVCYFQLLYYIQKFSDTPTVVSGGKSKSLCVSDAKPFLFWQCHIKSIMWVLFIKLLVYFNVSLPFMLHGVF